MTNRIKQIYFTAVKRLEDLEYDRGFYENFYSWGRGKEYRQTKLKITIIERLYDK